MRATTRKCGCARCGLKLTGSDKRKYHPACPNRAELISRNRTKAVNRRWQRKLAVETQPDEDDISADAIERKFSEALEYLKAKRRAA